MLFSLFLGVLTGCGEKPVTESVINRHHIKNLEVGDLVKLRDISNGNWDYVCLLTPYSGSVKDYGNKWKEIIDSKIPELNLNTLNTERWYLLFAKNGTVVANSRLKEFIRYKNFSPVITRRLNEISLEPEYCVVFDRAAIYKTKFMSSEFIIFGEIQE